MIQCANPSCMQRALYLREGGVFYIDRPSGGDESGKTGLSRRTIWLCRLCCTRVRVESWRPPGEQLRITAQQKCFSPNTYAYDWVLPNAS